MMIGQRLRLLREEKKLKQLDIAKILGVSRTTYTQYETGKSEPDSEMLNKLADIFNTSVDYILGRTEKYNPADEISSAVKEDPELADFWNTLREREDLKLLFKQTKTLEPKEIQQIIRIIKAKEYYSKSRDHSGTLQIF